jgi:hypothetical protein
VCRVRPTMWKEASTADSKISSASIGEYPYKRKSLWRHGICTIVRTRENQHEMCISSHLSSLGLSTASVDLPKPKKKVSTHCSFTRYSRGKLLILLDAKKIR